MDRAAKDSVKSIADVLLWVAIGAFVAALIFLIFFRFSPYRLVNVHGPSMQPTLTDGDLIVLKTTPKIERDQIAVFDLPDEWANAVSKSTESNLIKRVVGLPGDRLSYDGNQVNIQSENGKSYILREPKLSGCRLPSGSELTVPKGEYFLAGDNRIQSFDSMAAWCQGLDPLIQKDTIGINGELQTRIGLFSF